VPARAVFLDDYQRVAVELTRSFGVDPAVELISIDEHIDGEDALEGVLTGADVVVAMRERTQFPASLINRLPDLRLLITTGTANAVMDIDAAARAGICVCGTRGAITPTSELTWGLIFALLRQIPAADAGMRNGEWQSTMGTAVAGKTLGVLGAGRLGGLVAEAGKAFRMDVIAWSENLTIERAGAVGAQLVTKEEIFARSDVLSIHLVLSDRTRGLVAEPELRSMKRSAVIINTSRGPIIDEPALLRALQEDWIAGAALDVYDTEPLPANHPLRSLPNTVLTPHLGYVADDCYEVFFRDIAEDINAFLAGAPVRVLNPGWEFARR
jgi:phosphoglycerate dehydrogenase-like enzyme